MLLFLILINTIQTQTLKCVSNNINETYTRGDYMTICIHFIPQDGKAQRLAFNVKVDRYTALQAANSYSVLKPTSTSNYTLAIQANKHDLVSPKVDYIINGTNVFPIYSVVINMESGNVTDIIWDNGCWDSGMECLDYTLTNPNGEQYSDSNNYYKTCATSADCDAKIYVSFVGTDASSNYMESSGKRISRFRQYSVSDMFSSAKNIFGSYVDQIRT